MPFKAKGIVSGISIAQNNHLVNRQTHEQSSKNHHSLATICGMYDIPFQLSRRRAFLWYRHQKTQC